MNCGIKEKERNLVGRLVFIICLGSIIQSGENVKLPQFIPLFSSYTINNSRRFKFGAEAFAIPFESAHTPHHHQGACVVLGCRFQDGKHYYL